MICGAQPTVPARDYERGAGHQQTLQHRLTEEATFRDFFAEAALNENASLITGSACGVFVENVDDPLMQEIRYPDKLARGKAMDKILRATPASS